MKLAGSSSAFDQLLRSGDLTQLEWIDFCAHELLADGAVFDVRHFPRTDSDYLAQVKKMAVDLGLTVAAVRDDAFFAGDERSGALSFEIAVALGAPLLAAPLPAQTSVTWAQVQTRLGAATALAKRVNVTVAVTNKASTFGETTHDLRRVTKEADSAWLRYGPRLDAFDAGSEPELLLPKTVLAWCAAEASQSTRTKTLELLHSYIGFLVLDADGGSASAAQTKDAFAKWREASRTTIVNRT
ncbi:MAG TPA: hypothetical protein VFE17_06455 [Candidatus Baltobacteraceae bacterium]|jgi:hypothetical protein|nr:hypothetical protein [Candidatus Baltobacteraceae bacterium]